MNKRIVFILVALILVGFFGFKYFANQNFSKEILTLKILGPKTAHTGDEITYTVVYKNNGNFILQNPKLIFDLPKNSLTEDSQTRLLQEVKDVYPGDQGMVQFKTRLLGKESDLKVAHAQFSYTPKNLSARYESDTTFSTNIDAVPVTLEIDAPEQMQQGQQASFTINYSSDIDYPLENVSIKVDDAGGFTAKSSFPVSLDNIEWKLNTLSKGQKGTVTIKGLVAYNAPDALHFWAHLGVWQDGAFIIIKDVSQDVKVLPSVIFEQNPSTQNVIPTIPGTTSGSFGQVSQ